MAQPCTSLNKEKSDIQKIYRIQVLNKNVISDYTFNPNRFESQQDLQLII